MAKQYKDQAFLDLIGKNITRLRQEKLLSQEKLAELAEIDTRQIGRLERGETNASISLIKKIADALKVDICDIVR